MKSLVRTLFFISGAVLIVFSLIFLLRLNRTEFGSSNDSSITNQPSTKPVTNLIESVQITPSCQVEIITSEGKLTLNTNFEANSSKCDQYLVWSVSPSKKYLAFENLSEGIDSSLVVYDLDKQTEFTLDNLGEFSILDLKFLPKDRLLILASQGLKGKQFLRLYNLYNVKLETETNTNRQVVSSHSLVENSFQRDLFDLIKPAAYLAISGEEIRVLDQDRDVNIPLLTITADELDL